MTHSTKNKIWIFLWLLTLGLTIYLLWDQQVSFLEKEILFSLTLLTAVLNVAVRIRDDKDLEILDEILVVKKTFLKEKRYNLNLILSWSESHYSLLGFNTNSIITIVTQSREKVKIYRKGTEDYEKVSDFLNDKLLTKYEKPDRSDISPQR